MAVMGGAYALFLLMGLVQLWIMIGALASWTGSTFIGVLIAFFSVGIPIPWFLAAHWYMEGTLPWAYIAAWAAAWISVGIVAARSSET